jgi:hypothetical protein
MTEIETEIEYDVIEKRKSQLDTAITDFNRNWTQYRDFAVAMAETGALDPYQISIYPYGSSEYINLSVTNSHYDAETEEWITDFDAKASVSRMSKFFRAAKKIAGYKNLEKKSS